MLTMRCAADVKQKPVHTRSPSPKHTSSSGKHSQDGDSLASEGAPDEQVQLLGTWHLAYTMMPRIRQHSRQHQT